MADLVKLALQRKLDAAEASGDTERAEAFRARLGSSAGEKKAAGDDYESWTVEDLRAEAGDLPVKRGDGQEGQPLKADYVKALTSRDKKAAKGA